MRKTFVSGLITLGAGTAALGAYILVFRPWHLRWGATEEEIARVMPEDEFVQHPTMVTNRAVTIRARPEEVWPWLVQLGAKRGGFYSYDWIERLMGLGITSTHRILPEFQHLEVGETAGLPAPVIALEPNRALIMGGRQTWGEGTWALVLYPVDERQTRLVSRTRYDLDWRKLIRVLPPRLIPFYLLFDPGEFVMIRKMLLGIKERAERLSEQAKGGAGEDAGGKPPGTGRG
jgi:hypothetical protein